MSCTAILEQLHLTVRVPAALPGPAVVAVRAALATGPFVARLRRAVRAAVRPDPALAPVRVTLSR